MPITRSVVTVVLAGMLVAGCGGKKPSGADPADVDLYGGKRGGHATFLSGSDVDFVDPGQTYYHFGFTVQFAVNRALYQFTPADPSSPVPDLAASEPQISPDNRTITVRLKPGVHYAPPVDREVVAADVKYAIQRGFATSVRTPYARAYFGDIEGAPAEPVPIRSLPSFSGIQTPDRYTLVFKLRAPVAQRVAAALTMPLTVPVPAEYARRFDRRDPSAYDSHVAFTGPYMIRHNRAGRLTGRDPGRRIELVRNPNWKRATDFRPAYLNTITINAVDDPAITQARRTLSGKDLLCCDQLQLPAPFTRRVRDRFPDQVGSAPSGGTRWIALNTTVPPLDNRDVRRAIVAGFDRSAARQVRGGDAAGSIAQSYLPPGVVGHEQSGGAGGFSSLDFMRDPHGDLAVAKRYLLAASRQGVPVSKEGLYAGRERLLMVTVTGEVGTRMAQVVRAQLGRLGFRLRVRSVPEDVLYARFCGVRRARVAICPTVAWFKDFSDPEEMLAPTFGRTASQEGEDVNWSLLTDPAIEARMRKAALLSGADRARAWADVNRAVVEQAPGIPYLWAEAVQVSSANLEGVMSPFSSTWDLNFVRKR